MGRTNKLVDGCYSFWQVLRGYCSEGLCLGELSSLLFVGFAWRVCQAWTLFLHALASTSQGVHGGSLLQGAAFPLLAELLDEQRAQHAQRAQQQQPTAAQDGELGAAVQAAAASLLSGEAEAFVSGLATLAPAPAAEAVLRAAQQELDRLVEESLQARCLGLPWALWILGFSSWVLGVPGVLPLA